MAKHSKKSSTSRRRAEVNALYLDYARRSALEAALKDPSRAGAPPPQAQRVRPEEIENLLGVNCHDLVLIPAAGFPSAFFPRKGPPVFDRLEIFEWLRSKMGWATYLDTVEIYNEIERDRADCKATKKAAHNDR